MDLFEFDNSKKFQTLLGTSVENFSHIIGTDEAGRGPAAGGVWAAAVCFFDNIDKSLFQKLNDSKKLSEKAREELYEPIKNNSFYSIKSIDVSKIEEINILSSSLLAMKMAVEDVISQIKTERILTIVDGNKLIRDFNYPQEYIIKGDSKSATIAAASILAKVTRDRYMNEIDKTYPQYDWKNNKGYLTKKHIEAIKKFGTTEYHRLSFLKNITKAPNKN